MSSDTIQIMSRQHHRRRPLLALALLPWIATAIRIGGGKSTQGDDENPSQRPRAAVKADASAATTPPQQTPPLLLVVGSLNLDVIIEVDRLPRKGETIVARSPDAVTALGGKGANQAIAAARLASGDLTCQFVCQFGNDAHAERLERTLAGSGVALDACGRSASPSGQGIVLLEADGAVSSVVVGGSNAAWSEDLAERVAEQVRGASGVLLQREIPEMVNRVIAAAAHAAGCVLPWMEPPLAVSAVLGLQTMRHPPPSHAPSRAPAAAPSPRAASALWRTGCL